MGLRVASRLLVDWPALLSLPSLVTVAATRVADNVPGRPSRATFYLRNAWQGAIERSNEMRTLVAERQTARLQHIAGQEKSGQRKSIG